jgi:hypothetical protein
MNLSNSVKNHFSLSILKTKEYCIWNKIQMVEIERVFSKFYLQSQQILLSYHTEALRFERRLVCVSTF